MGMDPVESIINESKYYLICHFYTGRNMLTFGIFPTYINYCVEPSTKHPIILSNKNKLYAITLSDKKSLDCQNDNLLKEISNDRRIKLTEAIKSIESPEFIKLNEGYLILYSEPNFKGKINIYRLVIQTFQLQNSVKVFSFVNLTNENYILNFYMHDKRQFNLIFMHARSYHYNVSLIYRLNG